LAGLSGVSDKILKGVRGRLVNLRKMGHGKRQEVGVKGGNIPEKISLREETHPTLGRGASEKCGKSGDYTGGVGGTVEQLGEGTGG